MTSVWNSVLRNIFQKRFSDKAYNTLGARWLFFFVALDILAREDLYLEDLDRGFVAHNRSFATIGSETKKILWHPGYKLTTASLTFVYRMSKHSQCHVLNDNATTKTYFFYVERQIGLITVFDAILTGRQSGHKLQCLYENPKANNLFQN